MVLRLAPGKAFSQARGGREKGRKKGGRFIYTWKLKLMKILELIGVST